MPSAEASASAVRALEDGKLTGSWVLSSSKSDIRLRTKSMWGLAKVSGVFREVSGSGVVTQAGDVTGAITVSAASIDTGNKTRDGHLRSAAFFDVGKYPDIIFAVDQVTPFTGGVSVIGSLTTHGKTKRMTFTASVSAFDGDELWLDAEVAVNRVDFGMTWNQMGMASVDNTITVHAVFSKRT